MTAAQNLVYGTFLCGQTSGGCAVCHPSCGGDCTDGTCNSCSDSLAALKINTEACMCKSGYGSVDGEYHATCGRCDFYCGLCWKGQDPTQCTACLYYPTTPYGMEVVGSCTCPTGFAPIKQSVLAQCTTACTGCAYCLSADPADCFDNLEQVYTAKVVADNLDSVPITTETDDHKFCYMQHRPTIANTCGADPVQAVVTGEIQNYSNGSGAVFQPSQCKELLRAQLPYALHWFNTIFPTFEGPLINGNSPYWVFKAGIYMWILGMGPKVMQSTEWDDLRGLISNPNTDYAKVLVWLTGTPGFVSDGTYASMKPLPPSFVAWLAKPEICPSSSLWNCMILSPLFVYSKVCDTACDMKDICAAYLPGSTCATSGTNP